MAIAPSQAVFLSYASQDAEAVRRIAEALRASGVEVWFDQNELVGGDAWDQKIRGQIASCALFVPVISAATQARLEGYFRIEWKLAARRTHAMATAKAFLLPVVIDDTRDAGAHVPDEFREVQWTRLPGGESNVAFVQRIQRLLAPASEAAAAPPSAPVEGAGVRPPLGKKRGPWLGIAAIGAVAAGVIAFGVHSVSRPASPGAPGPASTTGLPASVSSSPAQALVDRATRVLETSDQLNRENVYLAEDMVKRALVLEPDNADAWLVSSQLSYLMIWLLTDNSAQRRELILQQSKRAVALAPASTPARLAAIDAQSLVFNTRGSAIMADLERDARALAAAEPQNWRALRSHGLVLRALFRGDESIAVTRRAYELSGKDPGMAADLINVFVRRHLFADAEIVRAEALAKGSSGRLLCWDAMLKLRWWGDTAAARDALKSWPGWLAQEDRGLFQAWQTWMWSRQPEQALSLTRVAARDMVRDYAFYGPVAALRAQAHELAGRSDAAAADWRATLERAERELATEPDNEPGLYWKSWALARLGRVAEAKPLVSILTQRNPRETSAFFKATYLEPLQLLVGEKQLALAGLRRRLTAIDDSLGLTRAMLELDPAYDAVRADPEFQAILLDAPAPQAAVSTQAQDKSVAVLAFKNLSGDPAREFFSDGLSEAVTDVLGRVPGLKVVGSASAFSFKGRAVPIPEIARQLGVTHLVEGTVLQEGTTVRITAKLIKADGFQVWVSDKLEREAKNIFALHDEVAGLIAKNLSLKLGASSAGASASVDPQAYQFYLAARQAFNLSTPEGVNRAEELLSRALALAPGLARAHAALSDVRRNQAQGARTAGAISQRNSPAMLGILAAAKQAVSLDPDLPEARVALGAAHWMAWNIDEAKRELAQAIALNPNYAAGHHIMARVLETDGRIDEALAEYRRAVELDPLFSRLADNYSQSLVCAGRLDEALIYADRALALQPENMQAMGLKASILARLLRSAEGKAVAETLESRGGYAAFWAVNAFALAGDRVAAERVLGQRLLTSIDAITFAALGRHDEVIDSIRSGMLAANVAAGIYYFPSFDPIREDPRFLKALADSGATEAHARAQVWRKANPPEKVELKR